MAKKGVKVPNLTKYMQNATASLAQLMIEWAAASHACRPTAPLPPKREIKRKGRK